MVEAASVAAFASLLADRSRAAICLALLDGRAWTVGELARHIGVAPSTASEHTAALVDSGLLTGERQGRHRYVRLASPDVAHVVEDLAAMAGARSQPTTLRAVRAGAELAAGRTCYDHLAGRLGVWLFGGMRTAGFLGTRDGLSITADGTAWLDTLGVVGEWPRRRPLLRTCLDWTERRPHLAGSIGASIHAAFLELRLTERGSRPRAVRLTERGREELQPVLGRIS